MPSDRTIRVPDAPALVAGVSRAAWLSPDGEIAELPLAEAAERAAGRPPVVCHAAATAARLDTAPFRAYDLLELFAFVHPAAFCVPTPRGLAAALRLPAPGADPADQAACLLAACQRLLHDLTAQPGNLATARRIAMTMGRGGWPWTPAVLAAMGLETEAAPLGSGLDVWARLPAWEEKAPPPPPTDAPIGEDEARDRLAVLLGPGAELRPAQSDYAAAVAAAFRPCDVAGAANVVLAEAGTGVGKTLGYMAPASLWSERNGGAVWISTYTRNLQRQVDQELDRLFPAPGEKRRRSVVRKGRENYLCLLNLEESARDLGSRAGDAVPLGLLARWAEASRDGDMIGGDFPAWLAGVLGRRRTLELTDHRGECVYSACPHYGRCFVENSRRRARYAEIVVANHALVMVQAARGEYGQQLPTRYVFDEGHHVFDAADSAFSANLSGVEGSELRRWIRGPEGGRRRSRARGLEARLGDLVKGLPAAEQALGDSVRAAACLTGTGWLRRIVEAAPRGAMEGFLAHVHRQVLARVDNADTPYGLEASTAEPIPGLRQAARALGGELEQLHRPLQALRNALMGRLDEAADELDTATRVRIEAAGHGLRRRCDTLAAWRQMLAALEEETPDGFVDWFAVARIAGRDADVGLHRHWVDPTIPFAQSLLSRAHGVVLTSATLRDTAADEAEDWSAAEIRTGALHLARPARRSSLPSPFDHAARARVFIVTDVRRGDLEQTAAACRELFKAAGGGALGLFTAIQRLRAVHKRIAGPLADAGLPLYAQHVDVMDTGTLVDIFRAETDSCLLGTDALRDGVDIPGRALRLIVFDRVPWPRPDLLHRARRQAFGGNAYDDMIVRFRLKQAYGRLLRQQDDAGVFVLLDRMMPSRLLTAFPETVPVQRLGLAEVVREAGEFLAANSG